MDIAASAPTSLRSGGRRVFRLSVPGSRARTVLRSHVTA